MRQSACLILSILACMHIALTFSRRKIIPEDCRCGLVQSRKEDYGDYVIGGEHTEVNEYPWQARLIIEGELCGGSLISDRWVLTAAHCTTPNADTDTAQVILGSHSEYGMDGTFSSKPETIMIHPKYNQTASNYDFALVKMQDSVDFRKFQNIRPICLPEPGDESFVDETAIATGWGSLYALNQIDKFSASKTLREVELQVISNKKCEQETDYWISEQMVCAGGDGKGVGPGDSGGPLIAKTSGQSYQLIGVASFIKESKTAKYPSMFSRVSNQLNWIKKSIGRYFRTCPRQ